VKRAVGLLAAALAAAAVTAPGAAADEKDAPWGDAGGVAVSPDGANVYAAGVRTITFARDQSTGALTELDAHAPGGNAVAVSPGGQWVYVSAGPNFTHGINVIARDPATGLLTHVYPYRGDPGTPPIGDATDIAMAPDGRELYVAQAHDDAVLVLRADPATGALSFVQALYGGPGGVTGLERPLDIELSPDGRFLYAADGGVVGFSRDPESGELTPVGAWDTWSSAFNLTVSPDGKRLYAGMANYSVFDRDPVSGGLTFRTSTNLDPSCDYYCYEGGPLGVAPDSGSVFSSELADNRLFQATPTPDGTELAHTYTDGADGFQGLTDVSGLAWAPGGRMLYVVSEERRSREFIGRLGYTGKVQALAWDGTRLSQVQVVEPTFGSTEYGRNHLPGLSIDHGAIYTNDPDVELQIVPSSNLPSSLHLSNDPDFKTSELRRAEPSGLYPWRLDTSGPPERTVRHVYARMTDNGIGDVERLSDDIILDLIAPQVISARLERAAGRARLLLRARDNRSGVRRLQVARNRAHPSRPRRFARRVKLSGSPRRLWVRVIDGAGNRSHWRRASR
jgi:hypothetical protein